MLNLFKRLFGPDAPAEEVLAEVTDTEALSGIAALEAEVEELLNSGRPNMVENRLSGWFDDASGELFPGFPISTEDTVVDVGCGDGPVAVFCAEQGPQLIFADISEAAVNSMHKKLANTPAALCPLVTDANPLPLQSEIATRVVAMEVLEHVDDPAQFMSELVRIGKPGARYLLTVPGHLHEIVQKDLAPPSYFEKPNHIRIFEPGELEVLARDAGLELQESSSYGFYWSIWWYLFWACDQDLGAPPHPILQNWARTWFMLLKTEQGPRIKAVLDKVMPKSTAVLATKPLV